jgi:hypothetical protein
MSLSLHRLLPLFDRERQADRAVVLATVARKKLRADTSGKYFWAEFGDQGVIDLLYDSPTERQAVMYTLFNPARPAGVISDATLFDALSSARTQVGNSMVAGAGFANYRLRLSLAGKGRDHQGPGH